MNDREWKSNKVMIRRTESKSPEYEEDRGITESEKKEQRKRKRSPHLIVKMQILINLHSSLCIHFVVKGSKELVSTTSCNNLDKKLGYKTLESWITNQETNTANQPNGFLKSLDGIRLIEHDFLFKV